MEFFAFGVSFKGSDLHSLIFRDLFAQIDVLNCKSAFVRVHLSHRLYYVAMSQLQIKFDEFLRTVYWLTVRIFIISLLDNELLGKVLDQMVRRVRNLLVFKSKNTRLRILRIHMRKALLDLCNCHLHCLCLRLHFGHLFTLRILLLLLGIYGVLNRVYSIKCILL